MITYFQFRNALFIVLLKYSPLSIASARSTPCTTPAGAFDTYGKAILEQNGIYRLMCAPQSMQEDIANELKSNDKSGVYPEWNSGLKSWPNTQSGYYVYNLRSCGENAYKALLVIELNYPPDNQVTEENVIYLATQELRVEKENGRWVAFPLEEFKYIETNEGSVDWGCSELSGYTYTGTAHNIQVNVTTQTIHSVDNSIQTGDNIFGPDYYYDTTPKPNAEFSTAKKSHRASCTHLGTQEERDTITQIGISYASIDSEEEHLEELQAATGNSSGSDNQGCGWSSNTTKAGWGPTIDMSGGGSGCEPDMDIPSPLYYVCDLYINKELVAEMELQLQEEVTE